jgi:hypothetical protein
VIKIAKMIRDGVVCVARVPSYHLFNFTIIVIVVLRDFFFAGQFKIELGTICLLGEVTIKVS